MAGDWLTYSYMIAIFYGIVAVLVVFNGDHKELCKIVGIDHRLVALFWLPYCLLVLVAYLFFNDE